MNNRPRVYSRAILPGNAQIQEHRFSCSVSAVAFPAYKQQLLQLATVRSVPQATEILHIKQAEKPAHVPSEAGRSRYYFSLRVLQAKQVGASLASSCKPQNAASKSAA